MIAQGAATAGNAEVSIPVVPCLPDFLPRWLACRKEIENVYGQVQDAAGNYYLAGAVLRPS